MSLNRFPILVWMVAHLLLISGCSNDEEKSVPAATKEKEYPVQEGWNSDLILSKAGRKQAVLRYGHMVRYDRAKKIHFDEGVQVDFFDENNQSTSHLTSERGVYYIDTENVEGMGNVVVVSDTGITLKTERLSWDNRRARIVSDTAVVVATPQQDTLYGIGFESASNLSWWVIKKPTGVSNRRIDIENLKSTFADTSAVKIHSGPDTVRQERTR